MVHKSTASKKMAIRKTNEGGVPKAAVGGHMGKRYMGVRQSPSGRWVAEIKATAQKIRLWLGTFDTAEEAARAYDEAACLLRGANTRTNFWSRPGGARPTPSVLPAKVVNHILSHFESQRAAEGDQPQMHLPPRPILSSQRSQLQVQAAKEQMEIEPITRIAYSDQLLSDVSVSGSSSGSGEENEFSITYSCNMGMRFHDEMSMKGKEEEEEEVVVDMDLKRLEEELSCFYTPFEMAAVMEEERNKTHIEAYDYWLRLSTSAKIF